MERKKVEMVGTGEDLIGRDLEGLAALVTGGASGIGLATARLLVRRCAEVVVLDRAGPPDGEKFNAVICDVVDEASVRAAVAAAVATLGGLDILVNNAGIGAEGTVEDNSDDEWRRVLEVNVLGMVHVCRAALPALRASPNAAIVNTCSVVADVGLPQCAAYSASKGAVLALTRAMAADHLADGIRVNCVSPGTVDTPLLNRLLDKSQDPAAVRTALAARQPGGGLVSAEEVAAAICYLGSPAAASITGISLVVDCGLTGLRIPSSKA